MNIDYAAIIATANVRKEALQAFEAATIQFKAEMNCFEEDTLPAVREFIRAYKNLDNEALQLIPKQAAHAAWVLADRVAYASNALHNNYNAQEPGAMSGRKGLEVLTI